MIDIKVKIHDKFSFEFKISFIASPNTTIEDANEFGINTWLFVPNSLNINRATYTKERFYRDTTSHIRLITPIFSLDQICHLQNNPLERLKRSVDQLVAKPQDNYCINNFSFQVRMLCSIVKSAIRDQTFIISLAKNEKQLPTLVHAFIDQVLYLKKMYRDLSDTIDKATIGDQEVECYTFGDIFIGNVLEQHIYSLMQRLETKPQTYSKVKLLLYKLVSDEIDYKKQKGYSVLDQDNATNNYQVVMLRGILKKFIESDLFLNTKTAKDGALVEQFYYGIAAGVSMIFATVISFMAQLHYGNFTTPLFFALVISYVFKDRIKDLMRYYFSTQLGKKYFDTKRELKIQEEPIGWAKEAFDFVLEAKIPTDVMAMRKRSPLVEAENRMYSEQIILYRKLVSLSSSKIDDYKGYKFVGINDITRFNLTHFIQKMDNSSIPLYMPDNEEGYIRFWGEKVYALHFIIRCEGVQNLYYRKFRLLFNRDGIKEIKEIKENL